MFLQEHIADCLRFNKMDDLVKACGPEDECQDAPQKHADVMKEVVRKCLGEALGSLVPDPVASQKRGAKRKGCMRKPEEVLLEVASRLVEAQKLEKDTLAELATFRDALGQDVEKSESAQRKLAAWQGDAAYFGVLRPLLQSGHWPAFVESLAEPASVVSVTSELRTAFEGVNKKSLAEADKSQMMAALVKAAAARAPAGEYVCTVLTGLALFAEEASKQLRSITLRLCKDLSSRGASGVDFSGDAQLCEEVFFKGHWATDEIRLAAGKQEEKQELLAECAKLDEAVAELSCCNDLVQDLLALAKRAQEPADNGEGDDGSVREAVVRCWSAVKHKLLTLQDLAAQQPIKEAIEKVLSATRIAEIGPQVYEEHLNKFRLSAQALFTAARERRPEETRRQGEELQELRHQTTQSCALSDTPAFSRSCVSFICTEFANVCAALPSAVSEPVPDDLVSSRLLQSLNSVCDLEAHKQKLLHALERAACEDFLQEAISAKDRLEPLFAQKKQTLEALLQEALEALEGKLCDPALALPEFHETAPPGQQVKTAIKQLRQAEKNMENCGLSVDDAVKKAKSRARAQIVKWGIAALVCNAQAKQDNKKGADLRKALKEIWNSHAEDQEVRQTLGDGGIALVRSTLDHVPKAKAETDGAELGSAPKEGSAAATKRKQPAKRKQSG
jgi:hypothetical protein